LSTYIFKWFKVVLSPYIYWKNQFVRTDNPILKQNYKEAYENAELKMERHHLTLLSEEPPEWVSWAEWTVSDPFVKC